MPFNFLDFLTKNLPAANKRLGITSQVQVTSSQILVRVAATEDLPAYAVVTSLGRRANSGNPSANFRHVMGVSIEAIGSGFSGEVITVGEVENLGWSWTKGDSVYLNGTGLSSAPPETGFMQQIGNASGPTKLVLDLGTPILL
jgi:hypothetical protein